MSVAIPLEHPPLQVDWAFKNGVTAGASVQLVSVPTPCRGVLFGRDIGAAQSYVIGNQTTLPLNVVGTNVADMGWFIPIDDASKLWVQCSSAGPVNVPYAICR